MPEPLFLPALQGSFGDWTYYSALVRLSDIVERVGYATPLHENAGLAGQIQRRLDDRARADDIAEYLIRNDDRFFNALVIGVLGGQPEWHPFSLSSRQGEHDLGAVTERDQDLVGYLQLSGDETLFALDGQHRLAGIRRALNEQPALGNEKLTLLFVPHMATAAGIIRTRTLFISLNKKAVPVKRKDIIILDEVDLAAIISRRLIDTNPKFNRSIVDVDRFGNAIPARSSFWTTIGNFYDANKVIIENIIEGRVSAELDDAKKVRLPEDRIAFYQAGVVDFYDRLSAIEPLLARIFGAEPEIVGPAVVAARSVDNPRLLARPVGLKIITKAAAELRERYTLAETFVELGRVPLLMNRTPFANVIWDVDRGRMDTSGQALASRLLSYMLGLSPFDARLRQSYADWFGEDVAAVRAPRRLRAA
ncbi:DGQHR domain-containing protein [Methylobacterium mesophilicum SR1.6/6]|uniref:DGQHR domain-containing protein n=1 Tax=Methylobacterium mesophilicum SR1.6/6 TaxID=908290 RepID=A0A6B9FLI1_9HYPH|nr:DNA sulfur modification protein DndB [Methylobacterium mesophilicum]QGY03257.1 DGQHR domain-containing protein [Methylobacterium mesophilicum SR1.6/6]